MSSKHDENSLLIDTWIQQGRKRVMWSFFLSLSFSLSLFLSLSLSLSLWDLQTLVFPYFLPLTIPWYKHLQTLVLHTYRSSYQSSLFTVWELLLQEVEVDSQTEGDIARNLSHNLGTGLLEKTFYKKISSRKAFLAREAMESILSKAQESLENVSIFLTITSSFVLSEKISHSLSSISTMFSLTYSPSLSTIVSLSLCLLISCLLQCYRDYCLAYKKFASSKNPVHLQEYYSTHNDYVQQLHATNGMLKLYQTEILPRLLMVIVLFETHIFLSPVFCFLNFSMICRVFLSRCEFSSDQNLSKIRIRIYKFPHVWTTVWVVHVIKRKLNPHPIHYFTIVSTFE